ncbi:MAG: hypothetical protein AAGI15_09295 [Pseudomonadota bacterium]
MTVFHRRAARALLSILVSILAVSASAADGESPDRPRSERDLAVIAQMLPGLYANANQAYFERRLKDPENTRHERRDLRVTETASRTFELAVGAPGAEAQVTTAVLSEDGTVVAMAVTGADGARCTYHWRREAAQLRATPVGRCHRSLPRGYVLSEPELWIYPAANDSLAKDNAFRFHRARPFTCYADIPGVGGGRATPFERYDNLELHDQGGEVWFRTREETPREIGISMFLVDWPMNNATGIFTRNSLVVYVNERLPDGGRKEHGYAFTEPGVERLGINLKWLLALCFRESNANATPSL